MWQKIRNLLNPLPVIGVSKRNFLMISADIKKGTLIVSYKGRIKTGAFTDKTMHNMMTGVRFDKNVSEFLTAVGKLINQIKE